MILIFFMIHMNTFGLLGFAYSLVFRTDIKILVVEYVQLSGLRILKSGHGKLLKIFLNMRNVLECLE